MLLGRRICVDIAVTAFSIVSDELSVTTNFTHFEVLLVNESCPLRCIFAEMQATRIMMIEQGEEQRSKEKVCSLHLCLLLRAPSTSVCSFESPFLQLYG